MQCPKCGKNGYDGISRCAFCVTSDTPVTPVIPALVTPDTQVTTVTEEKVTPVTSNYVKTTVLEDGSAQTDLSPPLAGEVCVLCREKMPSAAALKQRAWRAKK